MPCCLQPQQAVRLGCALQEQRMLYERELMAIMTQFEVFNEAEVVSGCISRFARHKRKHGDVKAMVIHDVQALRRHVTQLRTAPCLPQQWCTTVLHGSAVYGIWEALLHVRQQHHAPVA